MKRPRIFYGWWVVIAGVGITMLADTFFDYGFSAFFIPWRDSFGWSRAALSGVTGLSRLMMGITGPIIGWLIDKYGPRRIMFLGLGIMGLGFIALSRVNSLQMLYIVYIGLVSGGVSIGAFKPVQVAVANWFIRYRGRAMGLLMTGPGMGGSVVFLLAIFIDAYGWRAGAVLAGLLVWIVGLPLASLFRHRPEQYGLLPDGQAIPREMEVDQAIGKGSFIAQKTELLTGQQRKALARLQSPKRRRFWMGDVRPEIDLTMYQAIRTQAFWMMSLTFMLWSAMPAVVAVHLAPFLAERLDLEYVVVVSAISFFAFASIFSRLAAGFLGDYMNIRLLVSILLLMQGLGMLLITNIHTFAQVPIYVTIVAIPYGGLVPLRGVLQGYFFGRKSFGSIGGFMQFVNLPASVAAPIWVGWLADAFPDGYPIGFQIIAVSLVIAAISILAARRPHPPLTMGGPPLFQTS